MVIPDIDDPSDPKQIKRWLASRIEQSVDGEPADASEQPTDTVPADLIDDDDDVDRTEMTGTTDVDGLQGGRKSLEATTQTQSPAGMARLREKLGLPPIAGRVEPEAVLAKAPPASDREERTAGPVMPKQRVVAGPPSGPLPSLPPGPAPSGPLRSGAPKSAGRGELPVSSGPLPSGPTRSPSAPGSSRSPRPAPSGSLPLATGPSAGGPRGGRKVESPAPRNRVDPWAEEDDEDEAQTVFASPWAQEDVDWPGEPETVRSWGAMVRRQLEEEGDPDTVRHSKMPVGFISEAVIDDETVLDPSSGSERWRRDGLYHPPPPNIEPASSPLPVPPSQPEVDRLPSGRPTKRLAEGFVPEEEWVPMFSEESQPLPPSEPMPSGGPPPLPQGVRTVHLPESPASQSPSPPGLPTTPPLPPVDPPVASRSRGSASPPRPARRPWTPEQRRQTAAIVLMLALAAGMGFVVLLVSWLIG